MMDRHSRYSVLAYQTANPLATDPDVFASNLRRTLVALERGLAAYRDFGPPIKLVVLPEFALQGVPFRDNDRLREVAVELPGPVSENFARLAKKFDCTIVAGSVIEYDAAYPAHLFNTALVVGADGLLGRYRKCNPGLPVEPFTSPANVDGEPLDDLFCVLDLDIGRIGVTICYDNYFPEIWRELVWRGAEVVVSPSAVMHPYRTSERNDIWESVARVRCLENTVLGVFVNQGATMREFPPFAWGGGTFLVDQLGKVIAREDLDGERFVYGQLDLAGLRQHRREVVGNLFATQLRTRPYTWLAQPTVFDKARFARDEPISAAERLRLAREAAQLLFARDADDDQ